MSIPNPKYDHFKCVHCGHRKDGHHNRRGRCQHTLNGATCNCKKFKATPADIRLRNAKNFRACRKKKGGNDAIRGYGTESEKKHLTELIIKGICAEGVFRSLNRSPKAVLEDYIKWIDRRYPVICPNGVIIRGRDWQNMDVQEIRAHAQKLLDKEEGER